MRVTKLRATQVHGYIRFDIDFFPDLTFLIGLNGSGKTTALRLLMGLLTPAIDELVRIEFGDAVVEVESGEQQVEIRATRDSGKLTLSLSGVEPPLELEAAALELLTERRRRDDERATPVYRLIHDSAVFQGIRQLSTPMFLGLNRRIFGDDFGQPWSEPVSPRQRELLMRRRYEEHGPLAGLVSAELAEVSWIVRDTMSEIRAKQEILDKKLRERLLLSAVSFSPTEFTKIEPPTRAAIARYRERQAELERAASLLRLPVAEVKQALQNFFERMAGLLAAMEPSPSRSTRSQREKSNKPSDDVHAQALMTWIVNKSQVDQILQNLEGFENYAADRDALHDPINRFLNLLNEFLAQTEKRVALTAHDRLCVELPGGRTGPIETLSSGERQLCVMLSHLSLNERLAGSGVFIVDEPELSLHLSWQEMFVRSVRAANPDVQLIFATHSPAIILDMDDHCRSLSGD